MRVFTTIRAYGKLISAMFRIFTGVLYGMYKISKLEHAPITIFGGARLKWDSVYMKKASELAHKLAASGLPVLTGGGPGIMEAASCGAVDVKRHVITTIGITVKGLESPVSICLPETIVIDSYAARKWLLINYSLGFVVFPGGFGTLNELTDLLTLIQTKLRVGSPIVLIGKDYWKPFVDWMIDSALKNDLIAHEDLDLFTITDDIDEAFAILKKHVHPPKVSPLQDSRNHA